MQSGTWERITLDCGTWIEKKYTKKGVLIEFRTSEGFSQQAIDENLTPHEQQCLANVNINNDNGSV